MNIITTSRRSPMLMSAGLIPLSINRPRVVLTDGGHPSGKLHKLTRFRTAAVIVCDDAVGTSWSSGHARPDPTEFGARGGNIL